MGRRGEEEAEEEEGGGAGKAVVGKVLVVGTRHLPIHRLRGLLPVERSHSCSSGCW